MKGNSTFDCIVVRLYILEQSGTIHLKESKTNFEIYYLSNIVLFIIV